MYNVENGIIHTRNRRKISPAFMLPHDKSENESKQFSIYVIAKNDREAAWLIGISNVTLMNILY